MYYSRNKGFAKDSPKASSSTWKGAAAARSDNNFSLKVLRFPNEGYQLPVIFHASDPLPVPERWTEQRDPNRDAPSSVKIINGISSGFHFQKSSCDDNSFFFEPRSNYLCFAHNRRFSRPQIYCSVFLAFNASNIATFNCS